MPGTPGGRRHAPGSLDPHALHATVLEVYDGLRATIFTAVATPTNPTGQSPPDDARRRLDRLRHSLAPFPDRRLVPDPFVRPRPVTLTFPPVGLKPLTIAPITGTSTHDATVRLAGRVYDGLRLVKLREVTNPATGETFVGAEYPNAFEYETEVVIGGRPVRGPVTCPGPPATEHYADLPWTAELWDRLFDAHFEALFPFYFSPHFAPHPGALRTALEHEAALVFASTPPQKPAARPSPAKPAKGGAGTGGLAKLIAALSKHHRYAEDDFRTEPIGNNALAKAAGVAPSVASTFFKSKFGSYKDYCTACRDVVKLKASLKVLNGEFAPHHLYGRRPAHEDSRDDG